MRPAAPTALIYGASRAHDRVTSEHPGRDVHEIGTGLEEFCHIGQIPDIF